MKRHHVRLLVLLVLSPGPVLAQEEGRPNQPGSNEVEVRFHDESVVRMTILQESLDVFTKYGKLTVPTKDILKIQFGIHLADGLGKKIDALVKDLGSNSFHDREAASKGLLAYGPKAYAALVVAARNKDPELNQRAQGLIKNLREQFSAEQLMVRENDLIQTTEFPIIGRVISPTFRARTAYFGELEIPLSQVHAIRGLVHGDKKEVTVDAAKYGSGNGQWMDTGIEMSAEGHLSIKATGEVDLQPNNPGAITCGPAGFNQGGGFNPGVAGGRGGVRRQQGGALLGRIGETGTVFVIGDRYQGKSAQAGKLQLQIAPSPWGSQTGSYTVTINFGETPEMGP
jgi:hypothetical protein